MTDFSQISHDETVQAEVQGGGFTITPIEDGPCLLRLREVIELGAVQEEYDGKPKKNLSKKMKIVFEAVHGVNGSHAVTGDDGAHIRNKEVVLFMNKSFNEKAKYRKLFTKLNFDGQVPTEKGTCPSLHHFLGRGYLATVRNNVSEKNGKTYTNIDDETGAFTIGAAVVPELDPATGIPTGQVKDVPVPEMEGDQVCFLWGSNVSDDMLKAMWESLDRGTYEKDGEEHSRSFERMDITNPELNLEWIGSREQQLLMPDAIDQDLAAEAQEDPAPAEDPTPTPAAADSAEPAPAAEPTPAPAETPADADPLAALGL